MKNHRNIFQIALFVANASALLFFFSCSVEQQEVKSSACYPQAHISLQQKAAALQKKLDKARHTLSEDEKTVERLRLQLFEAELIAIESKVTYFEAQWNRNPQKVIQTIKQIETAKLFLEEREILNQIIRLGGANQQRAQILLDRVLALVTQVSENFPQ